MKRRTFIRAAGLAAGGAALAPGALWSALTERSADVVLRGAVVFDGTGAPPIEADVALAGDRIVAIGRGLSASGAEVVDLRGLALAPGFIDPHAHGEMGLLINPNAESKIRQGVTTQILGQDGGSVGIWGDEAYARMRERYRERHGIDIDFRDLPGYFRRMERTPASVNVASTIGAGTVRGHVVGNVDRPATPEELERMVALVEEALRAGACGLSSGLEYTPGAFADLDELVALSAPLRAWGLPYSSHMRNEDDQLIAAIEEALNVGQRAGVPVHISHLKAQGERNWWKAEPVLKMLEAAHEGGLDLTYDRYPYVAYSTGLGSLYPVWAREGGTDAFLGRLRDPEVAPRIEQAVRDKVAKLGSWDAVQITSTGSDSLAWVRGRRLGELAAERGEEPYALLERIIVEDRNGAGMVGFGMSEENTERILAHPLGMVCSDGSALATTGPLSEGTPHPRSYGSFPRVLGHYARDRKTFPLETAIHKMSGMVADRFRLEGRGRIVEGAFADLVAFDPDRVRDTATFEAPHSYPEGIPHVWVNGVAVIRDGEHTGAHPGRVVRPAAPAL